MKGGCDQKWQKLTRTNTVVSCVHQFLVFVVVVMQPHVPLESRKEGTSMQSSWYKVMVDV